MLCSPAFPPAPVSRVRIAPCLLGAVLAFLAFWAPPEVARSQGLDRIVVVVNDDVITQRELDAEMQAVLADIRARNASPPPVEALERQVVERLIADRLQMQVALARGIQVPEAAVEEAVADIAARNELTVEELDAVLRQEGLGIENVRSNVRRQMIVRQLVDREVARYVSVSSEEVDRFLAELEASGQVQTEVHLSHVLVAVPEGANLAAIAQAERQASTAYRALQQGAPFADVAAQYSDASDALEGGRIGWRSTGQLPELFVRALRNLQPGEFSDVLRSPNGFHIIRMDDRRGAARPMVEQTRARHILLAVDEFLSEQEATRRIQQLRERIVAGADFAELARAHSHDGLSGSRGGDLGWMTPGDSDPAFERAMDDLALGALSPPVRTRFGVHLIEVLERRQREADDELMRSVARQQIHSRRTEQEYERWLRRLRDEAYIVINL